MSNCSDKPNCYNCKWRRNVPGDVHSRCVFPGTDSNIFTGLFSDQNGAMLTKLGIVANPHGVRNGWFIWPMNFDPTWLLKCNGYTPKETDK